VAAKDRTDLVSTARQLLTTHDFHTGQPTTTKMMMMWVHQAPTEADTHSISVCWPCVRRSISRKGPRSLFEMVGAPHMVYIST
jgi:Tfp pilus assembly protein PilX